MTVYFHEEDLPEGVLRPGPVAIDTETMGLNPLRDRLCLVQISDGSGDEHLVRFKPGSAYDAPVLKAILTHPARLTLRSDVRRVGNECVSTCRSRGSPST